MIFTYEILLIKNHVCTYLPTKKKNTLYIEIVLNKSIIGNY